MKILRDEDLNDGGLMAVAIEALEAAFLARAGDRLISPPRHHVSFGDRGDLVFTIGGILGEAPLAGFRVYETFGGAEHCQIVAVWSVDDARLKGIVLGERLGSLRTGAIGGVDEGCNKPSHFLAETLPGARLEILPNTGHGVNIEEPDRVNRMVAEMSRKQ